MEQHGQRGQGFDESQIAFNRLRERLCGPIDRATRYAQAIARVQECQLALAEAIQGLKTVMEEGRHD